MLDRENRESDQLGGNEGQLMAGGGEQQSQETARPKGRGRGFASMDPAKQREIASKGGKAAHAKGTAHEFTSEEAREAGRKGGQARGKNNRTH
jgi:general stress protein YciG